MTDVSAHPGPGTAADRDKARAQQTAVARGATFDSSAIRPAVVLIGPPGSGKSTVGAAIARSTGLQFRDTDLDIERQAGRSIPDIFLIDGEDRFRELERAAVLTALAEHPGVLALGGRAILADDTRAHLLGHAVVFLNLSMPTHLTEALRTNMSGGKTVAQMLAEATSKVPFMGMAELRTRIDSTPTDQIVLDVRERDAYEAGHIPGARLLPRGQLELRVNSELPDPTARIVVCCEIGRISTLATATLRTMGFQRAVALDGGVKAWSEAGYPLRAGKEA